MTTQKGAKPEPKSRRFELRLRPEVERRLRELMADTGLDGQAVCISAINAMHEARFPGRQK